MSSWQEHIPEYLMLDQGQTTFTIQAEPTVITNQWNREQLEVKTNLGVWRVGCQSPIARELKKLADANKGLTGTVVTINRQGEGKNTRYTLAKAEPIKQQATQAKLQINPEAFNKLSPEQQAHVLKKLSMQQ